MTYIRYSLELLYRNDIETVPGCSYYAHLYYAEDATLHWSKLFQAWAEYQNVENFCFTEGQQKGKEKEKKEKISSTVIHQRQAIFRKATRRLENIP